VQIKNPTIIRVQLIYKGLLFNTSELSRYLNLLETYKNMAERLKNCYKR